MKIFTRTLADLQFVATIVYSYVSHVANTVHDKSQVRVKDPQCTRIHLNVGKTMAVFASSVWKVLKKAIAKLNITFVIHQKSAENAQLFSHATFAAHSRSKAKHN